MYAWLTSVWLEKAEGCTRTMTGRCKYVLMQRYSVTNGILYFISKLFSSKLVSFRKAIYIYTLF